MSDKLAYCGVERDGHLTVVTLNRPDVMNALHYEADLELQVVWDDFERDPDQWVGIVTGAGDRAFSAGNDLKEHAKLKKRRQFPAGGFAGLSTRLAMEKPVIAAVNGVAMGGGFELALSCDLVIAAENAFFALSEPLVGLAAVTGGSVFASRDWSATRHGCSAHRSARTRQGGLRTRVRDRARPARRRDPRGAQMGRSDAGMFADGASGNQAGRAPIAVQQGVRERVHQRFSGSDGASEQS
jgi:hypothetical protein